ncbi:uncharacterized protein RSE6_10934 [Rhynchosporium secalis]|uniref:Uncharacterized protein n=1 Tax=Rhynchosporium secalis TaxID=38038 RepID=A0A1E1MLQ4_RHYSE|nr:uncharacterized protein RSE6_10934 [Rhynchosporium secalis]
MPRRQTGNLTSVNEILKVIEFPTSILKRHDDMTKLTFGKCGFDA